MQVDRPRVDGRERALGLDLAEQLARGALDHGDRVERGGAQRDVAGGKAGAARQVAAVAAPAQLAGADQRVGALAPALAEDLVVGAAGLLGGAAERGLVSGGDQVRGLDPLVGVVEDRRLDRAGEELVRVAAEELVERVLAGDVDRDPVAPASGAAPHLLQAGDRAREGDADRRVELADVDPELERVGGDHREQVAEGEPALDLAPLLRRVAGAVGRDPRRQPGFAELLEPHPGEPLDQLDPAPALEKADRPRAVDDQVGEHLRRLGEHRAPDHRLRVDHRRVPDRDPAPGARSAVGVDQLELRPGEAGGELVRVGDRRRGENEPRLGCRRAGPPGAAGAGRWRRGSRTRRGRCAPRRRRRTRGWRGSRPSPCGGRAPPC